MDPKRTDGRAAVTIAAWSNKDAPKNTTAAELYPHQSIKEGDNVTLSCSSRGNPSMSTYRWFEGPQKTPTLGSLSLLALKNISWDSGPYICTATNDVGTGESPPLHLNIQHAPKGVNAALLEDPEEGKPMELLCAAKSSNPTETYFTWYKNGKVIQEGKTLKIESTVMDDAGVYHCVAQNALGNTSSTPVSVTVKSSPESSNFVILGGVAAAIFLILLLLVIFIIIRGRKKKAPLLAKDNPPPAATEYDRQHVGNHEEIPMKEHLYGNIDNYIHVRSENQRRSMQEFPELIDPNCSVEEGYSQLPGTEQEEQVSEELNYATIQHFERPETAPTDSSGEEIVEYATVRR